MKSRVFFYCFIISALFIYMAIAYFEVQFTEITKHLVFILLKIIAIIALAFICVGTTKLIKKLVK